MNMSDKRLPIDLVRELMQLRNTLDSLSQISWSFSVLNKQNPISILTEDEAAKLISAYTELVDHAKKLVAEA